MGKFAKLFELENNEQVLAQVSFNEAEDKFEMELRTDFNNGACARIKLGFDTEPEALEGLEKVTLERAVSFREETAKMFG